MEEKRAAFARELERERQEAARSLEQFRAELSLDAEMRRQVAASRVKVLGAIVERAREMQWGFENLRHPEDEGPDEKSFDKARRELITLVRDNTHLFSDAQALLLENHVQEMIGAINGSLKRGDGHSLNEASDRVDVICKDLRAIARDHLGLSESERS
jgi:hypothetical protein